MMIANHVNQTVCTTMYKRMMCTNVIFCYWKSYLVSLSRRIDTHKDTESNDFFYFVRKKIWRYQGSWFTFSICVDYQYISSFTCFIFAHQIFCWKGGTKCRISQSAAAFNHDIKMAWVYYSQSVWIITKFCTRYWPFRL